MKNYKSLGEMLKNKDFNTIIEYLSNLSEIDLKTLNNDEDKYSELDKLLFALPDYVMNENNLIPESIQLLKKLDELNVDFNKGYQFNMSPFLKSCEITNKEFITEYYNLLKKQNPDITIDKLGDNRGYTPLIFAINGEKTDIIETLINDFYIDINERLIFQNNQTPLHIACKDFKEKSIEKLMELNARPDIYDGDEYLAAELIPAFNEDLYDISEKNEIYYEKCDKLFQKLEEYKKNYTKNKQKIK